MELNGRLSETNPVSTGLPGATSRRTNTVSKSVQAALHPTVSENSGSGTINIHHFSALTLTAKERKQVKQHFNKINLQGLEEGISATLQAIKSRIEKGEITSADELKQKIEPIKVIINNFNKVGQNAPQAVKNAHATEFARQTVLVNDQEFSLRTKLLTQLTDVAIDKALTKFEKTPSNETVRTELLSAIKEIGKKDISITTEGDSIEFLGEIIAALPEQAPHITELKEILQHELDRSSILITPSDSPSILSSSSSSTSTLPTTSEKKGFKGLAARIAQWFSQFSGTKNQPSGENKQTSPFIPEPIHHPTFVQDTLMPDSSSSSELAELNAVSNAQETTEASFDVSPTAIESSDKEEQSSVAPPEITAAMEEAFKNENFEQILTTLGKYEDSLNPQPLPPHLLFQYGKFFMEQYQDLKSSNEESSLQDESLKRAFENLKAAAEQKDPSAQTALTGLLPLILAKYSEERAQGVSTPQEILNELEPLLQIFKEIKDLAATETIKDELQLSLKEIELAIKIQTDQLLE